MPLYIYKAANREGQVVHNRVEELNKYVLLKKIKNAGLMPIKITQIQFSKRAKRKPCRETDTGQRPGHRSSGVSLEEAGTHEKHWCF